MGAESTERLGNLSKITQLESVRGRARINPDVVALNYHTLMLL